MLHVDDPDRLRSMLMALQMPVSMPATPFAFADDDDSEEQLFEAKLWGMGGGCNLMIYRDDAIAETRKKAGLPSGGIGSLALQPAGMSRFRAQAALTRADVQHIPEPIMYHIPDDARRADPSLPPWMFSRVLFPHGGIGGAAGLISTGEGGSSMGGERVDGLLLAASASASPPLHFTFAVTWHRDLPTAPHRQRGLLSALPAGALGVVACRRVFVTAPAAKGEDGLLEAASFWHALGHAVVQRGRAEFEVVFPSGGPALHVRAVEDEAIGADAGGDEGSSARALSGSPPCRVAGWEWSVLAGRADAVAALEGAGLRVLDASAPRGGADWEVVADMGRAGLHGCVLRVTPVSSEQRAEAVLAVGEVSRTVGDGGAMGAAAAASLLLDAEMEHTYLLLPP